MTPAPPASYTTKNRATRLGAQWPRKRLCDTVLLGQQADSLDYKAITCGDTSYTSGITLKVSRELGISSIFAITVSQTPDLGHCVMLRGARTRASNEPEGSSGAFGV